MPPRDAAGNVIRPGTTNLQKFLDTDPNQDNPDNPDFELVIQELEGLRRNPNLSIDTVRQVDEVLAAARQGDTSVLTTPIDEQLNSNPFMDVLGKVGGGIMAGVDWASSVGRSSLNQLGQGLEALGLNSGQDAAFDTAQDELGFSGFLAGLSTGSDPVSGRDLFWDKDYQADGLAATGFAGEDSSFNIPDWIPVLPDRLPTPDIDTVMGLGAEIALDPLTYVRGPGIIDEATGLASIGSVRGGRAGHALRLNTMLRSDKYKDLSMDVKNAVQDSVERGGLTTLVRDANRSTLEGFDVDLLDSLGVQRGLNVRGLTVPKTEGFVELMGALKRGPLKEKAWTRAFDGLGDGISQSAVASFVKSLDADKVAKFTPFEQVGLRDVITRSSLVQRQGLALSADLIGMFSEKYDLIADISEESLRDAIEVVSKSTGDVGQASSEFTAAVVDLVAFAAESDLTVQDLVRGLDEFAGEYVTEAGERLPSPMGNPRGSDPSGLGLVQNSRQFGNGGGAVSPLAKFIASTDNATTSRVLAPGIAWALVNLDAHAARLLPSLDESASLKPWQYLGADTLKNYDEDLAERLAQLQPGLRGSGIVGRGFGSLRQLWGNVAVIQTLDKAADFGSEGLKSSFRKLADEQDVMNDLINKFGLQDFGPVDVLTRGLDEITGSSKSFLDQIRINDGEDVLSDAGTGVAQQFDNYINWVRTENFENLAMGDVTRPLARIEAVVETGQRHARALKNILNDLRNGKAIKALDHQYNNLNFKRAEDMFKEGTLFDEVDRIIAETWYKPDLTGPNVSSARAFDTRDRAVLQFAYQKPGGAQRIDDKLDELTHWIDEWTNVAQNTFDQYARHYRPEVAEQMRKIDTIFYNELIEHSVFGGAVQHILRDSTVATNRVSSLTREELTMLGEKVMDYHFSLEGVTDFFGGATGWADTMLESSRFLNRLNKASLGEIGPDKLLGVLAKGNRTFFRNQATSGPGFMQRNSSGAFRVNFLNGVRTLGVGGYREFGPVYNTSRAALRDEAINLMRPRTSNLWDDIDPDMLDQAHELAYSGVLISQSTATDTLDRAFEAQERSIGGGEEPGLIGRAASANANALARVQGTIEQPYTSLVQTMTQGPGKIGNGRLGANAAQITAGNSLDGLKAATKQELESYFRGALAWSTMRKGGTIADGMLAVSRNHFDYWDLTKSGQVIDELMPFFLFRGRMTRLTFETGMSSPGVIVQNERFRESSRERDPLGAGQFPRYTFGLGGYKGISFEFDPADPIDDVGMNTLKSFGNFVSAPGRNLDEFVQRELIDPLSPIIPWQQMLNIAGRGDGYYEEDLKPVAMMDGIPGSVMNTAVKIPGVKTLLEAGGLIDTRDGELFSTPGAMNYFTEILPLLAVTEKIGEGSGFFQGLEEDFGDNPTEAQLKSLEVDQIKRERQMFNVLFSFAGFPFEIISPDQRDRVADEIGRSIVDFDMAVKLLKSVRDRQYTEAAVRQVANPLEQAVADAAKRAGIDQMYAQVPFQDYRLDYAIPAPDGSILMAVEVDGYAFHSSAEQRLNDSERQADIENQGIPVYRVKSRAFREDPDGEALLLKEAYDEAMRQHVLSFTGG